MYIDVLVEDSRQPKSDILSNLIRTCGWLQNQVCLIPAEFSELT